MAASQPATSGPASTVVESDAIVTVHFVVDAFDGDAPSETNCVCFHLEATTDLAFGPSESTITVDAMSHVHYTRQRHDINPVDRTPIECDVVSDQEIPITIHARRSNGLITFRATTPGWSDNGTFLEHTVGTLPTFPSCYNGDFVQGVMLPGGMDPFRLYTPELIVEETKGSTSTTPIDFTYFDSPSDACISDATVTPAVYCERPYFAHLAPLETIIPVVSNQPPGFTGTWTLTVVG